jgi:hypothetical protein
MRGVKPRPRRLLELPGASAPGETGLKEFVVTFHRTRRERHLQDPRRSRRSSEGHRLLGSSQAQGSIVFGKQARASRNARANVAPLLRSRRSPAAWWARSRSLGTTRALAQLPDLLPGRSRFRKRSRLSPAVTSSRPSAVIRRPAMDETAERSSIPSPASRRENRTTRPCDVLPSRTR